MSLSVSLSPLPKLNACQSVPIQWTYAGSAEGQLKLVFVSAQQQQSSSAPVLKASTTSVVSSITTSRSSSSATATSSSTVPRTSSIPTPASSSSSTRVIPTAVFPPTITSRTPSSTLVRRAVTTSSGFTKTVTTVPLSVTSIGWAPIALPSGTYDLSAYLVPASAGGTEQVVGNLKGVQVIPGSDDSCLSSNSGALPSTNSASAATASTSQSTAIPASGADSGNAANEKGNSSNKGAIIGGVVGGVLGFALLAALLYFCIIRPRRRRRNEHHGSPLRPTASERKLGNWFSRRRGVEEGTRGVGSAFGWDFGTLGSSTAVGGSNPSRPGRGDSEVPMVSSVSGPISATHVQGFQGYGNPLQRNENVAAMYGNMALPDRPSVGGMIPPSRPAHPASHFDDSTSGADKDPEKANPFGRGGIEMIPILPRNNSGQTIGSGRITTAHSEYEFARAAAAGQQDHFPEQEILNSAGPYPAYFDSPPFGDELGQESAGINNAPSSQDHDHSLSESSHMTGNSHAQLLSYSRSPVSRPTMEARRASTVLPDEMGVQRRPSAANSISQRRKSGAAGTAGVERSASVRRKPVPIVDAYEEDSVAGMGLQAGDRSMRSAELLGAQVQVTGDPQGLKKQKSFVLDVERPLSQ